MGLWCHPPEQLAHCSPFFFSLGSRLSYPCSVWGLSLLGRRDLTFQFAPPMTHSCRTEYACLYSSYQPDRTQSEAPPWQVRSTCRHVHGSSRPGVLGFELCSMVRGAGWCGALHNRAPLHLYLRAVGSSPPMACVPWVAAVQPLNTP